jgi:hypothetical protein
MDDGPFSEDLRERALARFEAGETVRAISEALGISPSCVPNAVDPSRRPVRFRPARSMVTNPGCCPGNRLIACGIAAGQDRS